MYLTNGKRVYATLLEYEKTFELFDRAIHWKKLEDHYIMGNIFKIMHCLYSKPETFVQVGKATVALVFHI